MRIALATMRFAPAVGGIETHVWEIASRLAGAGHEVRIVTAQPEPLRLTGASLARVWCFPKGSAWGVVGARELRSAFRWADVVHLHGLRGSFGFAALHALKAVGAVAVVTPHLGGHSSAIRRASLPLQIRLLGGGLRHVDSIVGVSEFEVEFAIRCAGVPRTRGRVIRNGSELPGSSGEFEVAWPNRVVIASVGRLERYKGHEWLLRGWSEVAKGVTNPVCCIVGGGPDEARLRRIAGDLGVPAEFLFFGSGERARYSSFLRRVDVVCLLSEFESHPIVVEEARSVGKGIVVRDCTGMKELVGKGGVIGIERPRDARALGRAVATAVAHSRASEDVSSRATWENGAQLIERVYREVAAEGAGARRAV